MELATYLPYLVNRVARRFVDAFAPALAAADVDVGMWRVLSVLHRHGDLPVGALALLTSINVSTLSRLAGRMEARGLVRRRRGGDARQVIVAITRSGQRTTEKLIPAARALEDGAAEALTGPELAALRRLLTKLHAGIPDEAGSRRQPRSGSRRSMASETVPVSAAKQRRIQPSAPSPKARPGARPTPASSIRVCENATESVMPSTEKKA